MYRRDPYNADNKLWLSFSHIKLHCLLLFKMPDSGGSLLFFFFCVCVCVHLLPLHIIFCAFISRLMWAIFNDLQTQEMKKKRERKHFNKYKKRVTTYTYYIITHTHIPTQTFKHTEKIEFIIFVSLRHGAFFPPDYFIFFFPLSIYLRFFVLLFQCECIFCCTVHFLLLSSSILLCYSSSLSRFSFVVTFHYSKYMWVLQCWKW